MMLERMREIMNRLPMARFNLEKARSRAEKCTQSFSHSPSASKQSIDEKVGSIILCEKIIDELKKELDEDRKIVEPMIDRLESARQRTVAKLRYIDGHNVFTISLELGICERQVFRIVKEAEENIEKMLKCH